MVMQGPVARLVRTPGEVRFAGRIHHYIGGFHIAVDDSLCVRVGERIGQFAGDPSRIVQFRLRQAEQDHGAVSYIFVEHAAMLANRVFNQPVQLSDEA